jgi:hypothetical protein
MIPWFFTRDEIQRFASLSLRNKSKKLDELRTNLTQTSVILEDRINEAEHLALKSARLMKTKLKEASKDMLHSFNSHIASTQPLLNTYVARKLEFALFETMAIEGFEFPEALFELKKDLDFGLFAVNSMDELENILAAEGDPFEELGIDLDKQISID